jgi:urease accessory protein
MLLSLLHLCDSLLPTGAFAHSEGLEWATSTGCVGDAAGLRAWLEVARDEGFARSEGPAVRLAWSAFEAGDGDALRRLDEELIALRPSRTTRGATCSMGLRLIKTWHAIHPDVRFDRLLSRRHDQSDGLEGPTFPVAFAAVCASAGIPLRDALGGFAYTRLAATVSAAMRAMPLGQTVAHELLAQLLAGVPAVVDDVLERNASPESFAPALDVAQMSQQYVHSRLFRS